MRLPARIVAFASLLTGSALAQASRPDVPHALPLIPPPVDHPAALGQPLWPSSTASQPASAESTQPAQGAPTAAGGKAPCDPAVARAEAFRSKRVDGDELAGAVRHVLDGLDWQENLLDARAIAASTGKPLLWFAALGDLDGFA